jgi:5-methylcytosine-specific restriction endonuclease McrA
MGISGRYCVCGNSISSAGWQNGKKRYKRICTQCIRKKEYVKHKKDKCDKCGFIPVWLGQLDVDHIDGNSNNNAIDNLMTLCANCHRLKTHINEDYLKR